MKSLSHKKVNTYIFFSKSCNAWFFNNINLQYLTKSNASYISRVHRRKMRTSVSVTFRSVIDFLEEL